MLMLERLKRKRSNTLARYVLSYNNITKRRKRQAASRRRRTKKQRDNILFLLGNVCKFCNFSDIRALAIDHINAGGNAERKKIGGGYYSKVLKDILNKKKHKYQLLCFNCNQIKKVENKE